MNTLLINFVAYYATQVRLALRDLPQGAIEDLTDGLEADLLDAMQESRRDAPASDLTLEDLITRFGEPHDYAVELRSAAGLPAASEVANSGDQTTRLNRVVGWARGELADLVALVNAVRVLPGLADFFISLRPVWWIWRGLILYVALFAISSAHTNFPLPQSFGALVLLLVLVVASVKFGQRAVTGDRPRREGKIMGVVNVVLVLLLIPTTSTAFAAYGPRDRAGVGNSYDAGFNDGVEVAGMEQEIVSEPLGATITIDGQPVTNLFVYDAEGNPVPKAQVVNQDGLPLSFSEGTAQFSEVNGEVQVWAGTADAYGRKLGNVFPKTIWTLEQDAEYCTAQDEQLWQEMRSGEFDLQEGKLFTFSDEEPVATVVSATPDDGEGNRVIVLTGGSFTNGQDCVMGMRIPSDTAVSQVFPAELIAPLVQEKTDTEVPPDSSSEDQEQPKGD